MANFTKNYETTGNTVDGGQKPKLSKEEILSNVLNDYRANLPETFTKVLCNDGTTQNQTNDPNARVMDACRNNGGRAEKQPVAQAQSKSPTKSIRSIFGKLAGAYNQNLIIAVILVGGYFAYKKFKK
jgi:hypothetical protein